MLSPQELDELQDLMVAAEMGNIRSREEKDQLRGLLASELSEARDMDWAELLEFGRLVMGLHLLTGRATAWQRQRAARGEA